MTCKAITAAGHRCTRHHRRDGYCDLHHPTQVELRKAEAARAKLISALHKKDNEQRAATTRILGLRNEIADAVLAGEIDTAMALAAKVRTLTEREPAIKAERDELREKLGWGKKE